MTHPTLRIPLYCAALAAACFPAVSPGQSYEDVLAKYEEWVERPALQKRTEVRQELARTGDERALAELIEDYERPEDPERFVRYLVAQIVMDEFGADAPPAVLARWRKQNAATEDAWLWYQTRRYTAIREFDEIAEFVGGRGDPFLQAATLEALAERVSSYDAPAGLPALCLRILVEPPRRDVERALMVEAVGSVLVAMRTKVRHEPWKEVAQAFIEHLDDDRTPQRTKVVISRQLTRIFDVPNLGFEAHWWRGELNREPNRQRNDGNTTTVPFFSVRTLGFRFVYVIDASDSMLRRVTDREKRELGPVTGAQPEDGDAEGGFVPHAEDIDWSRVVTRFDAAREYLRLSLQSLGDDHEFAVVLFGDEAQMLGATPKLVPATRGRIRKAIVELERIEPGPPQADRPDGVLRGKTNLHGGIAAAFQVTGSGMTRREEYVDPKAFVDGCDTVFLLSDGAPSWDDFVARDKADPDDQAGDQETGTLTQKTPFLNFYGPYAKPPFEFLVGDVRRMNLLRKAEIHCVGIGEANHRLLESIAEIGMGQAVRVESQRR